jgi:hypothetical protein
MYPAGPGQGSSASYSFAPHRRQYTASCSWPDSTVRAIQRELELGGQLYSVSMSPEGVKIVPKGRRKRHEMSWGALLSGDAELRRDLNMSLNLYDVLLSMDKDSV